MGRFWRKRAKWLPALAVIASITGMLLWRSGDLPPSVARFPDGTTFTFVAITKLTPAPWPHHVPPVRRLWWQKRYRDLWMKFPPWLQGKLPLQRSLWDSDGLLSSSGSLIPKYRLWFEVDGPPFDYSSWLVRDRRSTGYSSTGSGKAHWFFVDLDPPPPSHAETFELSIWSAASDQWITLDIKNPAHRPQAK